MIESTASPAITLPSGEQIPLPCGFSAHEVLFSGNCRFVHEDLLFAYDPTTNTGLAWCRFPAPNWQMIQPVTREGFEVWAANYSELLTVHALNEMVKHAEEVLARFEKASSTIN